MEYDPTEAGLARPEVKRKVLIGREAYLRALDEKPDKVMCTLTRGGHRPSTGEARHLLVREAVLTPTGETNAGNEGQRSSHTNTGDGPPSGKYIMMSYPPPECAEAGAVWRSSTSGSGTRSPVAPPLLDPDNQRMKR